MARRTCLGGDVLALCGILAAMTISQVVAQAKDNIPVNPKLLVTPPEGAIVLFGGKAEQMRDNWYARRSTDPPGWTVDDKGVATPNKRDISSKQEFGDCYLNVEFREPLQGSGNSGVGLEGRYEIQILNSYGKKPEAHQCGAIYSQTPPMVIASKPAGEWQTYDIFFRAPRFDAAGKVVEKAARDGVPKRDLDSRGRGDQRSDWHPLRAIQGRGAEGADRPPGRSRHRAVQKRVARAGELLNPRWRSPSEEPASVGQTRHDQALVLYHAQSVSHSHTVSVAGSRGGAPFASKLRPTTAASPFPFS